MRGKSFASTPDTVPALPDHDAEIAPDVVTTLFINSEWRRLISDAIQTYADYMIRYMDDSLVDDFRNKFQALLNDLYTVDAMDNTPVGTIAGFARSWSNIPDKWLLCDGSTIAQADYPDLTDVIDSTFLSGSDIVLPDLRQTFLRGALNSGLVGVTGGEDEVTLTVAEMPAHTHDFLKSTGTASQVLRSVIGNNSGSTAQVTSSVGGGEPHNNIPPFMYVAYAIKALP